MIRMNACYNTAMSQEAWLEWRDRVQLRESIEYELCHALQVRQWRRVREIRRWLTEARADCNEALAVYKRLRTTEGKEVDGTCLYDLHP